MRTAALVLTLAVTLTAFSLAQQPAATPEPAPPVTAAPEAAPPPVRPPPRPRVARPEPIAPDAAQETELAIEVVQVVCPAKQLPEISVKPLSDAKLSSTDLLKKLSEYGTARMLLRTEQRCNFANPVKVTTGRRVPVVQSVHTTSDGKVTPSVSYERVGTNLEFSGGWTEEDGQVRCDLDCQIEASTIGKAGVKVAPGVQLPTFGQLKMETHVSLASGQPVVMMANDHPNLGDDEELLTTVHFVRLKTIRIGQ